MIIRHPTSYVALRALLFVAPEPMKPEPCQEKPDMREAGCQTIFRLGGMARGPGPTGAVEGRVP